MRMFEKKRISAREPPLLEGEELYYRGVRVSGTVEIRKLLLSALMAAALAAVNSVTVFAETASTYTVSIPQTISLTNGTGASSTYTGKIPVKLSGSIQEGESLCISAPSDVDMTNGTINKSASVGTSNATVWDETAVSAGIAATNYSVSVDLTPGTWSGTAQLYITTGKTYDIVMGDESQSLLSDGEDATNVKFVVKDAGIVTVNEDGNIIPVDEGTTTVVKQVYDSTSGKQKYSTTYTINAIPRIHTIDKYKMWRALESLSWKPTTLKFVKKTEVPSGLTPLAYIQTNDSGKIGVYQSINVVYIAPVNGKDAEMYAPEDCSLFLDGDSVYTGLGNTLASISCSNLNTSKVTDMSWTQPLDFLVRRLCFLLLTTGNFLPPTTGTPSRKMDTEPLCRASAAAAVSSLRSNTVGSHNSCNFPLTLCADCG